MSNVQVFEKEDGRPDKRTDNIDPDVSHLDLKQNKTKQKGIQNNDKTIVIKSATTSSFT